MSLRILASSVTPDEASSVHNKGFNNLIQRHHIRNAERATRKERYHAEKAELYVRKADDNQLPERDRNKLLRKAAKQRASAAYHLSMAKKHCSSAARKGQVATSVVGVSTELNNAQAAGLVGVVSDRSAQQPAYVCSYPTQNDDDSEETHEESPSSRRNFVQSRRRFASPSRLAVAQQDSPSWKRRKAPVTRHQLRKGSRSLRSTRTVERSGNWLMDGHLQQQKKKLRGTFIRNNRIMYITPSQLALASGKLNHVELHKKETSRFALNQLKHKSKQVRKNVQTRALRTDKVGQNGLPFSSSDLRMKYRELRSTYTVESRCCKVTTAQLQQAAKSLSKILNTKDHPTESEKTCLTPTQFRLQASQLHHITFTKGCQPRFSAIEFQEVGSRLHHVIPSVRLCLSRRVSPALLMRALNRLQPTQTIVKGGLSAFVDATPKKERHSTSQLQKPSSIANDQSSSEAQTVLPATGIESQ